MGAAALRWGAFVGAASAVVACVYVLFGVLVNVEHSAVPPAPTMPAPAEPSALVVDVADPPAAAQPKPRAVAPKPKPKAKPAATVVSPGAPGRVLDAVRAAPASPPAPPTQPRAANPKPKARPLPEPTPADTTLELHRELAEAKAKRPRWQPDKIVHTEVPRPPAAKPEQKHRQKRHKPDAGVVDLPTAPAAPVKDELRPAERPGPRHERR